MGIEELDLKVKLIEARVVSLEEFKDFCKDTHQGHIRNDDIHHTTAERHFELINKALISHEAMSSSITDLSNSVKSLSSFIDTNKESLNLIFSILSGLKGMKKAVIRLAAIVAAIGVILGAAITTWSILSSPHILETLMKLGTIQ